VQPGSEAHPSSYSVRSRGKGALATEWNGRCVKLVVHLESKLRMGGAMPTVGVCGDSCHIGCA